MEGNIDATKLCDPSNLWPAQDCKLQDKASLMASPNILLE